MGKIRIDLIGSTLQAKDYPDNYREIRFSINPDINKTGSDAVENPLQLNVPDLTFSNGAYDILLNRRTSGQLFEGVPIDFYSVRPGQADFLIVNSLIDLTNANWDDLNKRVTAAIIEAGGIDYFSIMERNTTYEYLATPTDAGGLGIITPANYVYVPYVISTIPNWREALMALIFFISLIIDLIDVIQQLVRLIVKLLNIFEWTTFLQIIVFIAYLITLIVLIVESFKIIVSFIIQNVKYHAGMYWEDLLRTGCEALGLGFESPIFNEAIYSNEVIIPEKYQQPQNPETDLYGFNFVNTDPNEGQEGFFNGTIGRLMQITLDRFNARRYITTNTQGQRVLRIVRKDQEATTSNYQVPKPYRRISSNPNSADLIANTFIGYSVDTNDLNTLEEFIGTVVEVNERSGTFTNIANRLDKGDKTIIHPLALGKRKNDFTLPERLILDFADIIGPVIEEINRAIVIATVSVNQVLTQLEGFTSVLNLLGLPNNIDNAVNNLTPLQAAGLGVVFGAVTGSPSGGAITFMHVFITNLGANFVLDSIAGQQIGNNQFPDIGAEIENRIGMLKLENDWVNVPKLVRIVPATNAIDIDLADVQPTALEDYNNFHFIDSFVISTGFPTANQKLIDTVENVKFNCRDFVLLAGNFFFIDQEGNQVELIEPTEWDPFAESLDKLTYKRANLHTPGMVRSITQGERR